MRFYFSAADTGCIKYSHSAVQNVYPQSEIDSGAYRKQKNCSFLPWITEALMKSIPTQTDNRGAFIHSARFDISMTGTTLQFTAIKWRYHIIRDEVFYRREPDSFPRHHFGRRKRKTISLWDEAQDWRVISRRPNLNSLNIRPDYTSFNSSIDATQLIFSYIQYLEQYARIIINYETFTSKLGNKARNSLPRFPKFRIILTHTFHSMNCWKQWCQIKNTKICKKQNWQM